MMKDIKKYQKMEKLKKWSEEIQRIVPYIDKFKTLNNRIHPRIQNVRITDINDLSHDTKLFKFVSDNPQKPLAVFRAGQYIGLTVEINGVTTVRPYSLASSPNQLSYYEIGVKRRENGFVSPYLLDNVKIGDKFEITEPLGQFYYNPLFHGQDLVFIAGGCGITPFISMLRYFSDLELPINITVIYGCLTQQDILFKEELDAINHKNSNVSIHYVLSEAKSTWDGLCGYISKDIINKIISNPSTKFYYLCGNRPMYNFILSELTQLEIPSHHILFEAFGVPDDITKFPGWPMEINKSTTFNITLDLYQDGKRESISFEALATNPLLNSIEAQKINELKIRSGCRSGECALCRTKLISGKVYVPPEVTIREMDQTFGYIHPCISYPISDLHLDLTMI